LLKAIAYTTFLWPSSVCSSVPVVVSQICGARRHAWQALVPEDSYHKAWGGRQ